ncbi:MAG TPA: GGDEF domain-containing protein [Candidatus Acidoferrales bacterium]|nr:GGDEF domain-containing protein [Candidatus Acidoferrales bacterium]
MGFSRTRAAWLIALLVVVLALPSIAITVYLEYEASALIAGVQNERAGLNRIVALEAFDRAAAQYVLARQCRLPGAKPLLGRLDAAAATFAQVPSPLPLPASWNAVLTQSRTVRSGRPSPSDDDALFDALDATFVSTADASGLTFDPDFAGISLSDAVSYRLPEALAQVRGARGQLCTVGTIPSLEQRLNLKRRQVLFDKSIADAMQDTGDSVRMLAARFDMAPLSAAFGRALRGSSDASAQLGAYMTAPLPSNRFATEQSLDVATLDLAALMDTEFPFIDRILAERLGGYQRQEVVRLIPGFVGLLAAVLVAGLMARLLSQRTALEVARQTAAEQERMALHDGLTGIMNRRAFFSALERAVSGGTNHGVICVFDIDHFKKINDTYGHATGDELLVRLAETIEESVRTSDAVARLGGDEFAVFIHPPVERDDVERILKRITSVMKLPVTIRGKDVRASVSVGAALIGGESMDEVQEALERADAALYQAKTAARGSYSFSDADTTF